MRLSVLTLARGRRLHLQRLIEGLCRSKVTPDELLIADMGGPPIEYANAQFPIRVLPLKHRDLQLAKARNLAASEARNDFLICLDVDCIPMAGLLGAMGNVLEDRDALLCADIRYLDQAAMSGDWNEQTLLRDSISHPVRSFPPSGLRLESNPGLFWSLAFAIRADLFNRIGGFDERFIGYGAEDTDFGFRAHRLGVDLLFLGGACAFHQYHDSFDPPLQHFDDIIRNAALFHRIWNIWPMQGWLDSFERLGLVHREPDRLIKIIAPDASQIAAAKQQQVRI